jgi:hypothetical protein
MRALKIILLILLLIPLTVGFVGLQIGADALSVLRPHFYLSVLKQQGVFSSLPDLVLQALEQNQLSLPASDKEKFVAVIKEAFDPVWLETQIEPLLTETSGYLLGRTGELTATLSTEVIFDRFFETYAKTARPGELADARRTLAQVAPRFETISVAQLAQNPGIIMARAQIKRGLNILLLTAIGVALLIALNSLLAAGLVGGMRWSAAACINSGILGLLLTIPAKLVKTDLLAGMNTPDLPPAVAQIVEHASQGLADGLIGVITLNAIIFLGAGVVLAILAGILAVFRAKKRAPIAVSPSPSAAVGAGETAQTSGG